MNEPSITISEAEFAEALRAALSGIDAPDFVTGPGRSGAIAAVYASYVLHRPFVPYGHKPGEDGASVLVIDTVAMSGRTIRKAEARYSRMNRRTTALTVYPQNDRRHHFWFESPGRNGRP